MILRRTVIAGLAGACLGPARAEEALPFGGPFDLAAKGGRRVTDTDLRGRTLLVLFGFTHCPDICPTSLLTIAQALKQLGPLAARVQTVFITLDPERDTADVLADYVGSFDPGFLGLSGTEAEIAAVAKLYRVLRLKVRTGADPAGYTIDHGTLTYVVNPDGKVVSLIPHGADAAKIAAVLRPRL
jgi:cytochrome oxidase Cu insertion factor (SCO1/SenC/PrrC family)